MRGAKITPISAPTTCEKNIAFGLVSVRYPVLKSCIRCAAVEVATRTTLQEIYRRGKHSGGCGTAANEGLVVL